MKTLGIITLIILAITFVGCVGSEQPTQTTPPTPEVNPPTETTPNEPNTPNEQPETVSWCEAGTSWSYTGTSGGATGQMTFEIKGIETYEGQQMCHAVGESNIGEQKMRTDYYFTEDEERVCMVMTDLNSNQEISRTCYNG